MSQANVKPATAVNPLTTTAGNPIADNQNSLTAGARGRCS